MALKFARSFGAHVTQFTTSSSKKQDAIRPGAHKVVLSGDPAAMTKPIQKINEAYERLLRNDVNYRFVIDMASLKA